LPPGSKTSSPFWSRPEPAFAPRHCISREKVNLEIQAFNSLDAQREACAAFILSQKHEGWTLVATLYDDGGYSGGTMERPALKRLMTDIEAGQIDVVVVYKVDRLTRALSDFARLVEVFDRRGVSFVSITPPKPLSASGRRAIAPDRDQKSGRTFRHRQNDWFARSKPRCR
jgi:DNA invertase Pin-like site-specific DNA recombinase